MGAGDCDDQSILLATLLSLNGIEPRLRVTATSKRGDWSHIYVMAGLPKYAPTKWVALDSTLPGRRFGLEAPYAKHADFDA
jgi:transglutaminase-like putative cysteine protease